MNRRNFLQSSGAVCAGVAITKSIPAFADAVQSGAGWRTFEVTTRVEVLKPNGGTHIWLPSALIRDTPFQRTHANKFNAEGGSAKFTKDKQNALGIISATYPAKGKPVLCSKRSADITSRLLRWIQRRCRPAEDQRERRT